MTWVDKTSIKVKVFSPARSKWIFSATSLIKELQEIFTINMIKSCSVGDYWKYFHVRFSFKVEPWGASHLCSLLLNNYCGNHHSLPLYFHHLSSILKHRHRRNVTSHHSLSHLSLLYFNFFNFHHKQTSITRWLSSLNNFHH